jgi:magnesium-transporting ATPase (P-type)
MSTVILVLDVLVRKLACSLLFSFLIAIVFVVVFVMVMMMSTNDDGKWRRGEKVGRSAMTVLFFILLFVSYCFLFSSLQSERTEKSKPMMSLYKKPTWKKSTSKWVHLQ